MAAGDIVVVIIIIITCSISSSIQETTRVKTARTWLLRLYDNQLEHDRLNVHSQCIPVRTARLPAQTARSGR